MQTEQTEERWAWCLNSQNNQWELRSNTRILDSTISEEELLNRLLNFYIAVTKAVTEIVTQAVIGAADDKITIQELLVLLTDECLKNRYIFKERKKGS